MDKFEVNGVEPLGVTLMGKGGTIAALGLALEAPQAAPAPAPAVPTPTMGV